MLPCRTTRQGWVLQNIRNSRYPRLRFSCYLFGVCCNSGYHCLTVGHLANDPAAGQHWHPGSSGHMCLRNRVNIDDSGWKHLGGQNLHAAGDKELPGRITFTAAGEQPFVLDESTSEDDGIQQGLERVERCADGLDRARTSRLCACDAWKAKSIA